MNIEIIRNMNIICESLIANDLEKTLTSATLEINYYEDRKENTKIICQTNEKHKAREYIKKQTEHIQDITIRYCENVIYIYY